MKIQIRLMLVIIPVLVVVHILTSFLTGYFSTLALEDQVRENAQLLSRSYSVHLDSTLNQYLNISQDLGSAVITAIHIETTLRAVRKRYPQFTHVFYTPADGKILEMAPYQSELIGFELGEIDAWQKAVNSQLPTISAPSNYLGQRSIIFFAPAIESNIVHQKPTVEGVVALILPLQDLFSYINNVTIGDSGSIFIVDDQGVFLHHQNAESILTEQLQSLSTVQDLDRLLGFMSNQQTGFATYSDIEGKKYISFSPIPSARWSLGVNGAYTEITSEIHKITLITVFVLIFGIIFGTIVMYFVVHSVVHPIEQLTVLAQKIAQGDRTITSDITTSSEVGLLSTSINSMVSELRDHHKKLEMTVEQRTIDLKRTNDELEQTVEELDAANSSLQKAHNNLELMVEERTLQLRKALNYIDNIIDSMPSILIGVDPDGIVTQWNTEAVRTTGLLATEAIRQPLVLAMPRLADDMGNVHKAILSKEEYVDPKRMRQDGSKTYYESVTVYPLISNGVEGAVIRIDDITERVAMQESLHQSQKLDAIGQLAGGVAHDFNNMLTGILGGAQLLKSQERNLDENGIKYVDLIIQSATRAADLTVKLLAFGRKGESLFTTIGVHNVIDDALAIFMRTIDKNITISVEKGAENQTVIGDHSAIQNALMNIGINASHAMPDGGTLQITTKNIRFNKIYCDSSTFDITPGEYIDIEMRDSGSGIRHDHLQKIFEPFFTTKNQSKGTGLGLSAVYGTVQDHHGAINVYSEVGTGTVFHIYLPCSEETAGFQQLDEKVIKGSGTILLVDDEEIIRITGKKIIEEMGYDVLIAENGREGVEIFKDQYAAIDLIIMDMIMPEMNGREAFIQMREIDPGCKVLIASGFTKNESLAELRRLGLAGFINKPFRDFELSRLIAKILL